MIIHGISKIIKLAPPDSQVLSASSLNAQAGVGNRGIKHLKTGLPSKPHLPITPDFLKKNCIKWNGSQESAACLCFFGFLRAGEAVLR